MSFGSEVGEAEAEAGTPAQHPRDGAASRRSLVLAVLLCCAPLDAVPPPRMRDQALAMGLPHAPRRGGGPAPPTWTQSWRLSDSLQIYACNYSGMLDLDLMSKFSLVALDWSNGKEVWANQHPMDAEALMVAQVALILARRPDTIVFVYRNTVKALSWFAHVREKLADPQYSGLFLRYNTSVQTPGSPRCDPAHSPAVCSDLYHDQMQTPQFAVLDDGQNGTCRAPCDSTVPTGEYLFDLRNASARAFVLEDLLGPTCLGNSNISGLYLDDYWVNASEPINPHGNQPPWGYCSHSRFGGPSEIDFRCLDDMGLSQKDVVDLTAGWSESFSAIYDAMDDAGALAYASFNFQSTPGPAVVRASLLSLCAAGNASSLYTSLFTLLFTTPDACCPANRNTTLEQFDEDLAFFMLVRGPFAWLGYSWTFCASVYTMPDALFLEYGDPLAVCSETSPGSGVFVREFAHATASFDTKSYKGSVLLHDVEAF